MPGSYSVSRIDLKKMLTALGIGEGAAEELVNKLNKMHRHVNVVFFVDMLEKLGLRQYDINNILRRIGVDDTTVAEVFNVLDEERIKSSFGRLVKLEVD
jgi:hypothetical protein